MLRTLISAVLFLVANAIGLLVAAAVLDDMSVSAEAFIIAVVIFTLVELLVQPLLTQMAVSRAGALRGSTALAATLVGLIVTSLVSDGLEIEGAVTWILATVIVWGAALIAGWILPLIFLKNRIEDREHEH
jgi:uncharacterized membrane protein YvlD (DUF360 family)